MWVILCSSSSSNAQARRDILQCGSYSTVVQRQCEHAASNAKRERVSTTPTTPLPHASSTPTPPLTRVSSSVAHTRQLESNTATTQPAVPHDDESPLHPLLHSHHYPLRTASAYSMSTSHTFGLVVLLHVLPLLQLLHSHRYPLRPSPTYSLSSLPDLYYYTCYTDCYNTQKGKMVLPLLRILPLLTTLQLLLAIAS